MNGAMAESLRRRKTVVQGARTAPGFNPERLCQSLKGIFSSLK